MNKRKYKNKYQQETISSDYQPNGKGKIQINGRSKKRHCKKPITQAKNVINKRILKRKEDIPVETDTVESLKKFKESAAIRKKFGVQDIATAKPKIIIKSNDVSNKILEKEVTKLIFDKNE